MGGQGATRRVGVGQGRRLCFLSKAWRLPGRSLAISIHQTSVTSRAFTSHTLPARLTPHTSPHTPPTGQELCPPDTGLLTQQGGCLVFSGSSVVFKHVDSG